MLNLFLANIYILYPLQTLENQKFSGWGFLVFSGGIKWEHWPEMGKQIFNIDRAASLLALHEERCINQS